MVSIVRAYTGPALVNEVDYGEYSRSLYWSSPLYATKLLNISTSMQVYCSTLCYSCKEGTYSTYTIYLRWSSAALSSLVTSKI